MCVCSAPLNLEAMLLPQPGVIVHLSRLQAKRVLSACSPVISSWWLLIVFDRNDTALWWKHTPTKPGPWSCEEILSDNAQVWFTTFVHSSKPCIHSILHIHPHGYWAATLQQLAVKCLAQGPLNGSCRATEEPLLIHPPLHLRIYTVGFMLIGPFLL